MSIKEEKYCRICVRVPENGYEIIDDVLKLMLENLMIKMNWSLTEDPVICHDCVEITRKSYYFKLTSIDKINRVEVKGEQFTKSTDNKYSEASISEYITICGFCMSRVKSKKQFPMDVLLNDSKFVEIFSFYKPEVEPDVIKRITTCIPCGESLKTYFHFVYNCMGMEKTMDTFIKSEVNVTAPQINLSNVCNFLFGSNTEQSQVCTPIVGVKKELDIFEGSKEDCEEMDIKDDIVNVNEKAGEIKNVLQVPTYECKNVQFETNQNHNFQIQREDGLEEIKYKCESGTCETKCKTRLRTHMLIHKNHSEIKMHKCGNCIYETKFKNDLNKHMLVHKDISQVTKYKCESCAYVTKRKDYLKSHMLIHKDNSEVTKYKCENCTYETKYRCALNRHMSVHNGSPEVTVKYKCANCAYVAKRKSYLKTHMLVHKSSSEVTKYKCKYCTYEAKHRSDLTKHQLVHKDISEVTIKYKCECCAYVAKRKDYLKTHMLIHKDSSEVTKYKCKNCTYETKYRCALNKHMSVYNGSCGPTVVN